MSSQPPARPDDLLAYQDALRRGHEALLSGNARQALTEYQAAAALAADRSLPHLAAGRALLALHRPADALAAFERAHQRAPTDSGALQGKAEALSRLGRAGEAAAVADEIQRLAAEAAASADQAAESTLPRAEVLTIAAERAWRDGRVETAVGQWLAAARYYAGEGHLDAALDACQQALLADAGEPRVHLELSRLYLARGWLEQAVERMELLARLVEMDEQADLRHELAGLARDHAAGDARLVELAERLGSAPPPPPESAPGSPPGTPAPG